MFLIFSAVIFSLLNCCCGQAIENATSADSLLNISKNTRMASNSGRGSKLNLVPSIHRDIGFQIHNVMEMLANVENFT